MKLKVLVACEFSQTVTKAFRDAGHEAYSCDIINTTGDKTFHFKCDVLELLDRKSDWDMMIAHPPCTFLANSGVRHLYNKINGVNHHNEERWENMYDGCYFFNKLKTYNIPKICIENPIPHKYAKAQIGDYTQKIQPWEFGHQQTKAICLWLYNLPKLQPTNIVGPPPKNMTQEEKRKWHAIHYASPGKDRGLKRSIFFEGIAKAMVEQWTK